MSGMHLTVRIVRVSWNYPVTIAHSVGMAITVRLATIGESLYTTAYNATDELRVWELRLRLCQALKFTAFFSWILFHNQVLADDTAFVSAYHEEPSQETILFHAVVRELRPPTEEEEMAIGDCIQLRHRSQLWNIVKGASYDLYLATRYSKGEHFSPGNKS